MLGSFTSRCAASARSNDGKSLLMTGPCCCSRAVVVSAAQARRAQGFPACSKLGLLSCMRGLHRGYSGVAVGPLLDQQLTFRCGGGAGVAPCRSQLPVQVEANALHYTAELHSTQWLRRGVTAGPFVEVLPVTPTVTLLLCQGWGGHKRACASVGA